MDNSDPTTKHQNSPHSCDPPDNGLIEQQMSVPEESGVGVMDDWTEGLSCAVDLDDFEVSAHISDTVEMSYNDAVSESNPDRVPFI